VRENSPVKRVVGTHVDISELRRHQRELERAAMTDDLTGLCNRRGMSDILGRISRNLTRGYRLAILHADLDMFKSVNDMSGHDAGHNVLRVTARRISNDLAGFDVIARIGGTPAE
jgi:diguanylate cyclase (GGDEF)-like protein